MLKMHTTNICVRVCVWIMFLNKYYTKYLWSSLLLQVKDVTRNKYVDGHYLTQMNFKTNTRQYSVNEIYHTLATHTFKLLRRFNGQLGVPIAPGFKPWPGYVRRGCFTFHFAPLYLGVASPFSPESAKSRLIRVIAGPVAFTGFNRLLMAD